MQYFIKRGEKVEGPYSREQLIGLVKAKKANSSDLIVTDELEPLQYFIKRGEKIEGPFSLEQLIELMKAKKANGSDLIATDELGPFEELGKTWGFIIGQDETTQPQNQSTCSFCGASVFKSATTCPKCASPIGSPPELETPQLQQPLLAAVPLAQPTPIATPTPSTCHNCGTTVSAAAQFCPQCATPVAQQQDLLAPRPTLQQPEQKTNTETGSENTPNVKEEIKALGNKTLEVTGVIAGQVGNQAKQLKNETAQIYNEQGMQAAGTHLAKSLVSKKFIYIGGIIGGVAVCCLILFFCALSWLFSGDSFDRVFKDFIAQEKRLVTVLEGIKDVEDAEAATPKLKAIAKKINSIGKRRDQLDLPNAKQLQSLADKYENKIKEQQAKVKNVLLKMDRDASRKVNDILGALRFQIF